MLGVFFVLIATGTAAVGQFQVDDIQCHGFLNWTIVKPKAHLGSPPLFRQTVAMNVVDGVVPNTAQGPENGEFYKCASTKGWSAKKSLTIDLHRTYLMSSVKTYLRQTAMRAEWQTGLQVYVGPNNNTHKGNTQCGSTYSYQNKNYEPVFNCSPPVKGRFVFLLKNDSNEENKHILAQGLHVCEVAVKVVTFNQLPPLPNACSRNVSLSTTVTYHCEEGYVSDGGKATSTCLESGTWSYPSLYCRKPCPLPSFKYKELLLRANFRNMAALYACPYGTVQGYQTMHCGDDGKWIENLKPCEAVDCGKPDDPIYGYHRKLSNNYKFKAKIEYACCYGYELQGERKASCQSTGKWDLQSSPRCQLMRCPELAPPQFGTVQLEGRNVNDSAKFMCDSGYDLVGAEVVTCEVINIGASWSHVLPTCKPKKCIRPRVPVNGRIIGEDFHYPNTIEFVCNQGYILTPAKSVWRCSENGKWKDNERRETNFPTCEPVSCGGPPAMRNGHIRGNNFVFGSRVEYYCDSGFKRVGSSTLECMHTRKWYPTPPKCLELLCRYLRAPENGKSLFTGLIVGSVVHYSCNPGYTIAINDEKVDNIEQVSLRCIQIGNQDTARSMWKGALTSMPPTCKP
ncbi:sushi, von Willebrand factor type A, EGF and pentraxin domain-containing protein 1-like [Oscarella lobularis]|uniref:sushi, von Willebrand factor type A, EGF and pentraxin domain-containing protein 1-like n=1 Tax=Oscarella lobularis TaxID=121494 RepID=UPI00331425B7